jgi:hypothetical protein
MNGVIPTNSKSKTTNLATAKGKRFLARLANRIAIGRKHAVSTGVVEIETTTELL